MNVIGLGKTGCSIVDKFSKYPQYKIHKVSIQEQDHPEKYEQNTNHTPFTLDGDDIDFFVSGDEIICAASLRVLENYKHCNIRIWK